MEGMRSDWYDYGTRFFDPALGHFTTQDPLATEIYWVSPYNNVPNNPINRNISHITYIIFGR